MSILNKIENLQKQEIDTRNNIQDMLSKQKITNEIKDTKEREYGKLQMEFFNRCFDDWGIRQDMKDIGANLLKGQNVIEKDFSNIHDLDDASYWNNGGLVTEAWYYGKEIKLPFSSNIEESFGVRIEKYHVEEIGLTMGTKYNISYFLNKLNNSSYGSKYINKSFNIDDVMRNQNDTYNLSFRFDTDIDFQNISKEQLSELSQDILSILYFNAISKSNNLESKQIGDIVLSDIGDRINPSYIWFIKNWKEANLANNLKHPDETNVKKPRYFLDKVFGYFDSKINKK
jgi:hypothetical protein